MIISIRGTNGSGKSTLVRTLLAQFKGAPIYGVLGPRRPEAYRLTVKGVAQPVFVLGSYHVATGGADQIQPYDLILELIEKYAAQGHVVFEGLLVSTNYGRVGQLLERWGKEAVLGYMETPLEACLANVNTRRGVRGDAREFDPRQATQKFHGIAKSRAKIDAENKLRVVGFTMADGPKQVVDLLRSAK